MDYVNIDVLRDLRPRRGPVFFLMQSTKHCTNYSIVQNDLNQSFGGRKEALGRNPDLVTEVERPRDYDGISP